MNKMCDPRIDLVREMCRQIIAKQIPDELEGFDYSWEAFLQLTGCQSILEFADLELRFKQGGMVRFLGAVGGLREIDSIQLYSVMLMVSSQLYQLSQGSKPNFKNLCRMLLDEARTRDLPDRILNMLKTESSRHLAIEHGIEVPTELKSPLISSGQLWVEWCSATRAKNNRPSECGLLDDHQVEKEFQSNPDAFELFVDETTVVLSCQGKRIDLWGDLKRSHRVLLGLILKSLSARSSLTWQSILLDVFDREVHSISKPNGQTVKRCFTELNQKLGGVFKDKIFAPSGQYMYVLQDGMTFCWIRPANKTSCLKTMSKEDEQELDWVDATWCDDAV